MGGMRFNNFGLDPNQLANISGPAFQPQQQMIPGGLPMGGAPLAAQGGLAPLPTAQAQPFAQSGLPQAQAQPMAQSGFQPQFNQGQFDQSQQAAFNAIPTGLTGAEAALQGAAFGSTGAILEGQDIARGDVRQGGVNALGQIQQGQQGITQGFNRARQGVQGAGNQAQGFVQGGVQQGIQNIQAGGNQAQNFLAQGGNQAQGLLNQGVGAIQRGTQGGMDFLNQSFQQAVDPISGFVQPGQEAQQLLAARNGALGPEAQAQAFEAFRQSPGLEFFAEEQERALVRNAAATGGTGGNRLRSELSRAAFGRAQSDLGRQDANLMGLSNQGLNAAQSIGSLRGQQGQLGSSLISQGGRDEAGLRQTGAGFAQNLGFAQGDVARGTSQDMAQLLQTGALTQADIVTNVGNQIAQLESTGALASGDLASRASAIEQATGQNLAEISQNTGANVAKIIQDMGSNSAQLRSQAGRDLAAAISESSASLANLQQQQGQGLSDIAGQVGGALANSLLQEGLLNADSTRQLATLLANIGIEGSTNQASLAADVGRFEAAGTLGMSNSAQEAIKGLGDIFSARQGTAQAASL